MSQENQEKSNIIDARSVPQWNTPAAQIEAQARAHEREIAQRFSHMLNGGKHDPVTMVVSLSPLVGSYLGILEAQTNGT